MSSIHTAIRSRRVQLVLLLFLLVAAMGASSSNNVYKYIYLMNKRVTELEKEAPSQSLVLVDAHGTVIGEVLGTGGIGRVEVLLESESDSDFPLVLSAARSEFRDLFDDYLTGPHYESTDCTGTPYLGSSPEGRDVDDEHLTLPSIVHGGHEVFIADTSEPVDVEIRSVAGWDGCYSPYESVEYFRVVEHIDLSERFTPPYEIAR